MERAHCDRKQAEPAEITKLMLQSCRRWLAGTRWIDWHTDSLSMWGHRMLLIHLGLILLPSPDPTLTKPVNGLLKTWLSQWCLQVLKCISFFWSSRFEHTRFTTAGNEESDQCLRQGTLCEITPSPGVGITSECTQLEQGCSSVLYMGSWVEHTKLGWSSNWEVARRAAKPLLSHLFAKGPWTMVLQSPASLPPLQRVANRDLATSIDAFHRAEDHLPDVVSCVSSLIIFFS